MEQRLPKVPVFSRIQLALSLLRLLSHSLALLMMDCYCYHVTASPTTTTTTPEAAFAASTLASTLAKGRQAGSQPVGQTNSTRRGKGVVVLQVLLLWHTEKLRSCPVYCSQLNKPRHNFFILETLTWRPTCAKPTFQMPDLLLVSIRRRLDEKYILPQISDKLVNTGENHSKSERNSLIPPSLSLSLSGTGLKGTQAIQLDTLGKSISLYWPSTLLLPRPPP